MLTNIFFNKIDQNIKVGSIGAIDANDCHSHVYFMVEFTSSPYTL